MSGALEQIGFADWPQGLCVPLLMVRDDAVPRLGLTFESYEEEGLGLHFVAIVRTERETFALVRGVFAPVGGTQILCMADASPTSARMTAFQDAFSISDEEIVWRTSLDQAVENPFAD
ncbi:MAG: hypothetical protein C0486_01255 [Erythrobacter sp.]|nr:hypothetical protein [Erythrobacter sp.]